MSLTHFDPCVILPSALSVDTLKLVNILPPKIVNFNGQNGD